MAQPNQIGLSLQLLLIILQEALQCHKKITAHQKRDHRPPKREDDDASSHTHRMSE